MILSRVHYIVSVAGFSSAHEMTHLIIICMRNTNMLISIGMLDSLSMMGTISRNVALHNRHEISNTTFTGLPNYIQT